jgi:hypothetical protein
MVEICPGCGYRFEARPEEGFFFGAFTINLSVTLGVLLLVVFGYIAVVAASGGDGPPLWPFLGGAGALAVLLPVVFYPFAKTIWAAIELALHADEDGRDRP